MLDLIEQTGMIRGRLRNLEMEWETVRAQIRKDYQRVEKANERSEKRKTMEEERIESHDGSVSVGESRAEADSPPLHGSFLRKLQAMKR